MPSSADGFLPSNYTGQLLVTFTQPTYVFNTPDIIKFGTVSAATATGTGTATWFANCSGVSNAYVLLSNSIGVLGEQRALVLSTLNIISSNTVTPIDFALRFYQT